MYVCSLIIVQTVCYIQQNDYILLCNHSLTEGFYVCIRIVIILKALKTYSTCHLPVNLRTNLKFYWLSLGLCWLFLSPSWRPKVSRLLQSWPFSSGTSCSRIWGLQNNWNLINHFLKLILSQKPGLSVLLVLIFIVGSFYSIFCSSIACFLLPQPTCFNPVLIFSFWNGLYK